MKLLKKLLLLLSLPFAACDFEDNYVDACAGKYGSQKVIDSIGHQYNLTNGIYFDEVRKDYMIPKHKNCDTIHLRISSSNLQFSYNDSFALSLARIFFADSLNNNVKTLKIDLEDGWPTVGSAKVTFSIDRQRILDNYVPGLDPDPEKAIYEINGQKTGENYLGIDVNLKRDYKNIKEIAAILRAKYDEEIKKRKLTHFAIDILVERPPGRLCTQKRYHFFYVKENGNI